MHQSFKPKLQKGPRRELLFSVYSIVSPPPATSISKMIIFKISMIFSRVAVNCFATRTTKILFSSLKRNNLLFVSQREKDRLGILTREKKFATILFQRRGCKKNSRKSLFSNFLPLLQKTDFS